MSYKGDIAAGTILYGKFTTRKDTGLPTALLDALSGSPSGPELQVYKDNSTTQSAVGITLTVNFDGITGLNHYTIDTSQDGTFYSAGSDFSIVISRGSVNSINVAGEMVAEFSIANRSALRPTVAGRALDVSAGGEAGVDWANVGSPTTALALTGTTIAVTQKVDVETIKTNPVVNGGTITFPTTATLASTTNITAGTITTATNVTNDVGITQAGADKVWSTTVRALTDKAGFALSAAGVQAIWDALTSALTTVGSVGKLIVDRLAVLARLDTTMESTGSPTDYVFTTRALAQAPSGTGSSAAVIAAAVWDEARAGHVAAGSFGQGVASVQGNVTGSVGGAVGSVTAGVTVTTNNDKTGYALSTAGNASVADKILDRGLVGGADATGSQARSVRNALRSIRNKVVMGPGTITVYEEDDTTTAWTGTTTTAPGDPLTGIDPA